VIYFKRANELKPAIAPRDGQTYEGGETDEVDLVDAGPLHARDKCLLARLVVGHRLATPDIAGTTMAAARTKRSFELLVWIWCWLHQKGKDRLQLRRSLGILYFSKV
jgi:hypothetical protein